MKATRGWTALVVVVAVAAAGVWYGLNHRGGAKSTTMGEVAVATGDIRSIVKTTGTVEPQNRLEIMPPIGGRLDEILVREGDRVRRGQVMAWMSSTERAALLDAALARGPEESARWSDVYKPTPLIAPMDGDVIVRAVEPGQTVSASDPVLVLSDRLIVKARVDETDIGKVKLGVPTDVSLDAYPAVAMTGRVDHISYESKVVNNVTVYEVQIVLGEIPPIVRSGMSATVTIVCDSKQGVVLVEWNLVEQTKEGAFIRVRSKGERPERRLVTLGVSDEDKVEVVSGLQAGDRILTSQKSYAPETSKKQERNPFLPTPPGRTGRRP